MEITKLETIRVKEFGSIIWVQVHTNKGHVGLGETWYAPAVVESAVHDLFSPILVGRDPLAIEKHWYDMFRLNDHFGYGGAETRAISAIDTALWDIAGQVTGQPIYNLLGGACRDRIRIYNTCGSYGNIQDGRLVFEDPVRLAKSLLDSGITAMKCSPTDFLAEESQGQYLSSHDLDRALEPVRKIREAVGDSIAIANDGHARWNLTNAIRIAQAMEPLDMLWQEELLSTLNVDSHLRLAQNTKTPICVAERLISRYQYREFIEKGAAEIVMPDLIWTGGISETKKIAILASTYQLPVCPHDATGPVNVFACAHICMNIPNAMLMETVRAYYQGWYGRFVEPNLKIENGYLHAPEGPGLGTKLRADVRSRPDVSIRTSDTKGEYPLRSSSPSRQWTLDARRGM
jgi:L-alanine-DL-glutamate epimerase-like enolase superfamily enzyme